MCRGISPLLSCRATPSTGLSFPKSLDELRGLSRKLQLLKEEHFYGMLGLFAAAYLYKQTFAIPGSVFLVNTSAISYFLSPIL